ncbi:MAG: protein kinase domain-containing protein [Terriglobales bacterium]
MEAPAIVGQTLGHYQVLGKIGAGGMGVVFRAHDSRLGRDVAVKILPPVFSADEERLRRFEQEARATAKLNHPNILAIYDIGRHEGSPYIVSELLEGMTLRQRLQAGGALSIRATVDFAGQIARGLVAAHEKHIVHRDLKPENLFITREGRVKILDFGVAKLTRGDELGASDAHTMTGATAAGTVLGTTGYMSPEQVRGKPVDHRSDIFSFGSILYEMLCGERAFRGETVADTITAILKEEPPELPALDHKVPFAMQRILHHCLEKEPEQRCQSARDLVFELETLAGMSELVAAAGRRPWRPGKRLLWALLGVLALAAVLAGGALVGRRMMGKQAPSYQQLTARRGTVWAARFSPDANTIVYSASFNGQPSDVFSTRPGSPEARAFKLENADLLAISSSGEMAVLLRRSSQTFFPIGTLARLPLGGGAPREVLDNVMRADWSPDGSQLAVVRYLGGKARLEYPVGKLLFETAGWIGCPRVSPKGDRIALIEHQPGWLDGGWVTIVDLQGKRTRLSEEWMEIQGLAWSPSGDEVWFTGAKGAGSTALYAVTLGGKERVVARIPGDLMLHDIARDGSVLLTNYHTETPVMGLAPGEQKERDLSWLENVGVFDLSPDGRTFLFQYYGENSGEGYSSYVRKTDGSPAVRLGDGTAVALSPDGKWAATVGSDPWQSVLLPTGAGEIRKLDHQPVQRQGDYRWTAESRSIVFTGQEAGKPPRTYVQEIDGGSPRPITPPGVTGSLVSPDGTMLFGASADGKPAVVSLKTGEVQEPRGLDQREWVIRWSADSHWLYVYQGKQLPITIHRVDPWSGRRELIRQITPADPAGILGSSRVYVSADGNSYVYQSERHLSELYLARGLTQ